MRVALICKDKPDHQETRKSNREAHVAYLRKSGVVEMAGPFLDADGEMCGSLIILNVGSMADAERFTANDPYANAGLFETVDLQTWNKVIG